jgi:transposase InsO family protein
MPWKETNVQDERVKFVAAWKTGGWTMTDLCREFGISRRTGYKYLDRYRDQGVDGLKDQSRAPKRRPNATRAEVEQLILEMREKHPSWGPRKLLPRLAGRFPQVKDWPCESTVAEILKRNGCIVAKKKRSKAPPTLFPFAHIGAPNDLWCADFKGHFTVGDGQRCDPLTISDAHSRYLLECRGLLATDTRHVQPAFERVFKEFGMPRALRTDNGSPFSARSLGGLSRFSVWLLKLGINLERIEPGKPQQNGRHERMHLTLKKETALPPRSSLETQQAAFDYFRNEYNTERPHEALSYRCPGDIYVPSHRKFPGKPPEVHYPTHMEIHTVADEGTVRYGEHRVFLSSALREERVAFEEIDERHRRVHFAHAVLGVLDAYTGVLLKYDSPKYARISESV